MALRKLPSVCSTLRAAVCELTNGLPAETRAYSQLALVNKGIAAGPGGRSSISGITATVFGCSGFLARYVVQGLASTGSQMVLPYRCDELDVQHLKPMGDLGQIVRYPDFDLRDDEMIRHAISKSNVVINLVGTNKETWNYGFEDVHVDMTRRIAQACADAGSVERFMHVSCLAAAPDAPSRRLRTKAEGEAIVRELLPHATIFKVAPVVGPEDVLTREYANMGKRSPVVPLVRDGATRLQPVYVRDVADAMINSLNSYDSRGQDYYLAGPQVVELKEFIGMLFETMREPFTPVPYPAKVAQAVGSVYEWVQKRAPPLPLSHVYFADYLAEMSVDHVMPDRPGLLTIQDLGVKPMSCMEGTPIEHIRHMRAGGYDMGTIAAKDSPAGKGFATQE